MPDNFINLIKAITDVPPDQEEKFVTLVREQSIKRGDNFIRAGQFSKSIGFVKEGLFRYFYISDDGDEYTKGFFEEHSVLSAYSAIIESRPTYFSIQALEDTVIEVVPYEPFSQLFAEHPCWNEFLVAMLKKGFVTKEAREREFLLLNAEQRYRLFLERYPNLESRVKQHMVASYLGIAPESLSRVRKNAGLLT